MAVTTLTVTPVKIKEEIENELLEDVKITDIKLNAIKTDLDSLNLTGCKLENDCEEEDLDVKSLVSPSLIPTEFDSSVKKENNEKIELYKSLVVEIECIKQGLDKNVYNFLSNKETLSPSKDVGTNMVDVSNQHVSTVELPVESSNTEVAPLEKTPDTTRSKRKFNSSDDNLIESNSPTTKRRCVHFAEEESIKSTRIYESLAGPLTFTPSKKLPGISILKNKSHGCEISSDSVPIKKKSAKQLIKEKIKKVRYKKVGNKRKLNLNNKQKSTKKFLKKDLTEKHADSSVENENDKKIGTYKSLVVEIERINQGLDENFYNISSSNRTLSPSKNVDTNMVDDSSQSVSTVELPVDSSNAEVVPLEKPPDISKSKRKFNSSDESNNNPTTKRRSVTFAEEESIESIRIYESLAEPLTFTPSKTLPGISILKNKSPHREISSDIMPIKKKSTKQLSKEKIKKVGNKKMLNPNYQPKSKKKILKKDLIEKHKDSSVKNEKDKKIGTYKSLVVEIERINQRLDGNFYNISSSNGTLSPSKNVDTNMVDDSSQSVSTVELPVDSSNAGVVPLEKSSDTTESKRKFNSSDNNLIKSNNNSPTIKRRPVKNKNPSHKTSSDIGPIKKARYRKVGNKRTFHLNNKPKSTKILEQDPIENHKDSSVKNENDAKIGTYKSLVVEIERINQGLDGNFYNISSSKETLSPSKDVSTQHVSTIELPVNSSNTEVVPLENPPDSSKNSSVKNENYRKIGIYKSLVVEIESIKQVLDENVNNLSSNKETFPPSKDVCTNTVDVSNQHVSTVELPVKSSNTEEVPLEKSPDTSKSKRKFNSSDDDLIESNDSPTIKQQQVRNKNSSRKISSDSVLIKKKKTKLLSGEKIIEVRYRKVGNRRKLYLNNKPKSKKKILKKDLIENHEGEPTIKGKRDKSPCKNADEETAVDVDSSSKKLFSHKQKYKSQSNYNYAHPSAYFRCICGSWSKSVEEMDKHFSCCGKWQPLVLLTKLNF